MAPKAKKKPKTKARCTGKTRTGKPCKAAPLKGTKRCLAHSDADTRGSVGFVAAAGNQGGRPRLPSPTEVARKLIEDNIAVILRPHFKVLGYDVETSPAGLALVPLDGGGAKLYGESRDGVVRASEYEDLGAQMAAADKLLDRVYGRPKQATEISGPDGGEIPVGGEVPTNADFHTDVAKILAESGAVPTGHPSHN